MTNPARPPYYDDLAASRAEAWRLLSEAATDPLAPMRRLTLATVGLDARPRARTVVLRKADPGAWRVRFHADTRSDKIAEIAADPRTALCAWDRDERAQIRLEGLSRVHVGDDIARIAWVAVPDEARNLYAVEPSPGDAIGEGGAYAPAPGGDGGFHHFAVVEVAVATLEWLHLGRGGHRRALFERAGGMRWLTP